MQKDKILILPNNKDLKLFRDFNSFILPLKDYAIGFESYFTLDEINELSKKYNIFVMINKFMHKEISNFAKLYNKFNNNIKFIIEDIGLTNIIDKKRTILFENHILSNYKAINYLKELGIENVVINNDLTIDEIMEIRKQTKSRLYYFYISKNVLMHSKRALISNFKTYNNFKDNEQTLNIFEKISNCSLYAKEENDQTIILNNKIFSASKYFKKLKKLDYLIINTTLLNEFEIKTVLKYYRNDKLNNILDTDYYFLDNEIKYKVGDLK